MKKSISILTLLLLAGNILFAQTWDIIDKSMAAYASAPAWGINQGGSAGGVITQQESYFTFTKTSTGKTGKWSWVKSSAKLADLTNNQAYSVEIKARVREIDKTTFPDNSSTGYESNQIALRLGYKSTALPIFLKYGDASTGKISTVSGAESYYSVNTSDWQIYRIVLHPDHTKYDVYIAGVEEPIFKNVTKITTGDATGVYIGAESLHRCNIDVEYVKMGTGDFFSTPQITNITLSQESHPSGSESSVLITANTTAIENGKTLTFSLINKNNEVVVTPIQANVASNTATATLTIPATIAEGVYTIKVTVDEQIGGIEVAPKTVSYEIIDPLFLQTWDILHRDFSTKGWEASPAWNQLKGGSVPASFVTQNEGFTTIYKMLAYGSGYYGFLTSPNVITLPNTAYTYEIKARTHAIDKTQFPDIQKPSASDVGGHESNQIALQLNNKIMSIHLIHGDDATGYIAPHIYDGTGVGPSQVEKHTINTSEWHVYRLIFNADNTKYDIYVDGKLLFEDVLVINKSGDNFVKIGGESWQRCNMDIEYVRIGTGDLITGHKPKITSMLLSSDSHVTNNARTIQVSAKTSSISDGQKLTVTFTNESGKSILPPSEITINANAGATDITIPASVTLGKYSITVASPDGKIGEETLNPQSMQYVVVNESPLDTKILPQVKTVGYVKELKDFTYIGPSKEFIFPSIIDTKKYTIDGKFKNGDAPIDRYYLYYAPHENPGGMFLSTAPTLDGPWTEYAGTSGMTPGTVIDYAWAANQSYVILTGAEKHISGCQVVWNEVQNKYIMYFHGPNTTTHYATSDDLINWTFGASIIVSHQFSPIGAEASYAKTFEHEIPGLGNKYVMLLMNQENQIRRIYWAHSKDGINWTPVSKPLISPDLDYKKIPGTDIKPNYDGGGTGANGNNVSGPFLMEKNGRYFVFCHGCTDKILVVEVGKGFDMEVHWGDYMKDTDVMLNINGTLTATRPAAPDFIQDDNGKWYMFFEAGGRLGANIGYSKEDDATHIPSNKVEPHSSISIHPTNVKKGQPLTIKSKDAEVLSVDIIDLSGNVVSSAKINSSSVHIQAPIMQGVYFVKVFTNDNQIKTERIIVTE